ncbi:MAG: AraC family transcriptional regulator [Chthoniobacterales bacterium]
MTTRNIPARKARQELSRLSLKIVVSSSSKCGRGWVLPYRAWPDYRLLLVRAGLGEVACPDRSYKLRRGSLLFGIPGETYGITHNERKPLVTSVVRFELQNSKGNKVSLPATFRTKICMEVSGFPLLEQLMLRVTNSISPRAIRAGMLLSPTHDNLSNNLLRSILWLIREDGHSDDLQTAPISYQDLIPALTYPMQTGELDPSTEKLARMCGISANTFRRRMQVCFGKSPKQFFLHRRMERAKLLLLESPYTVEAIAADLGYRETAHFCRQFKKVAGSTPGHFRTSNR